MIVIDYSGISMGAMHAFSDELRKGTQTDKEGLIRHVILNGIKSYKKKYSAKFGDVVLACDDRNYWRRDFFPQYKHSRKAGREGSEMDWDTIFRIKDEVQEALVKYFPYKTIMVPGAEADDVIACLVEYTQQFGKYEEVMIVASDGDFVQLQEYDNVSQFSPITKKLIKVNKKELREKIVTHIVKGDGGDGVPNILSPDDTYVTGARQKSIYQKRLDEFISLGFEACKNDEERRNWHRNETLVNFKHIPIHIKESIFEAYEKAPRGSKSDVMNYLIKSRCRQLLNEIDDF